MVNYIYYWYSLLYLIGRTVGVFLSASAINDASREPIEVIKKVNSAEWCPEVNVKKCCLHLYQCYLQVDRFADQINGEIVALSGMKFFYLTRKVLLTV